MKPNGKILNAALWLELALAYFLPFRSTDHFQYRMGFPAPFLSVYDAALGKSPFLSTHFNPIGLLLDVLVIYFILSACVKAYKRFQWNRIK